jgi:hypothetical protein
LTNKIDVYDFDRFIKDESINKLIETIITKKELTTIQKRDKIKEIMNLLLTKFINSLFANRIIQ